ncbi:MAG: hypothetical protein LBT12_06325, partial [Oscillospiraceae bacterium]|nr:hypothetical protein [Oscillospiraceae bacterium]
MSSVTPITGAVLPAAEIKTAAKTSSGIDFSQILAESLEREVTQGAITATGGSASQSSLGGYTGTVSGGGIEQLLLAAASSGEVSDAQLALFMLCTMMQGGSESASSPYLSMMAQMLSQLSGDTGSLRAEVMASGYDAYTKNTLDFGVFGAAVPQASGDGLAALPVEEWKPTVPAVVNTAGDRSPENLRAAVDQFDVENAERYRPHRNGSDTYCNIYVWDVTSALGAEIPHYVDSQTGAPRTYPDIQGATEQGAIAMERWLETD